MGSLHSSTKSKKQQYLCKSCGKRFLDYYTYNAYHERINSEIIHFTKEGLGIRNTARVLGISTTTLLRRIIVIANSIPRPAVIKGKIYEVDEMKTFLGKKDKKIWIAYALERESKKVVSFYVGARTNKTLKAVLKTLFFSEAKRIYTDGLRNYPYLIKKKIHKVTRFGTNHIERSNLNLRTHLKRLNRRAICFSRSVAMMSAVLKIYFWM
ncbi:MAG: IS1 family transposase [Moheibacter sp.]